MFLCVILDNNSGCIFLCLYKTMFYAKILLSKQYFKNILAHTVCEGALGDVQHFDCFLSPPPNHQDTIPY